MGTIATAQELAEARHEVESLEAHAACTRSHLKMAVDAGNEESVDRQAHELVRALRDLRMGRNILGDMEAGAGDWCPEDEL